MQDLRHKILEHEFMFLQQQAEALTTLWSKFLALFWHDCDSTSTITRIIRFFSSGIDCSLF